MSTPKNEHVQPLRTGILPGVTNDVNPEEQTSSGKPESDLRELEGELNREGTTPSGMESRIVSSSVLSSTMLVLCLRIFGKVYGEDISCILLDRMMIDMRRRIREFELLDISYIIISLSKLNYNNRGIISLLLRSVYTFIDEDSILDPHIITNLLLGFSRFKCKELKFYNIISTIIQKEEVLNEFLIHDAITIIQSYSKIHLINDKLFNKIINHIFNTKNLNTKSSIKLLSYFSKLNYTNTKFNNQLLEYINLKEINSTIELQVCLYKSTFHLRLQPLFHSRSVLPSALLITYL